MENNSYKKKDIWLYIIAGISLFFIIGFWLLNLFILKEKELTDRGAFGDMFGFANSLFSGLAFIGIIITILLQRKELSLQRQELKYTREELKRAANAQEKSEAALNRQAENLKISAKLSALNTLANYYGEEEKILKAIKPADNSLIKCGQKKRDYIREIEEILTGEAENLKK